jgi:RNA ligase (TIGR02306 family)
MCNLSLVDEVELVKQTPLNWLPALLGSLKTESGMEELDKRFKNIKGVYMRALASIQKIEELAPIEGADVIERARVLGWYLVVRKGEFQVGDPCIYFAIDSFLPQIPQFEFLAKGGSLKKMIVDGQEKQGYRLKTVMLRKQISQGLALPLKLFPNVSVEIGVDVTDLLNVLLYEAPVPACISGEVRGTLPGYIPKTDEERVQNLLLMLKEYMGKSFYATSKLDGTSMTVYKYEGDFGVCGHTLNFKEDVRNTFWRVTNKYDLRNKLPEGFAIQAELVGEGIQSNRLKLKGQDAYIFYVFDINAYRYLPLEEMQKFVADIGMKTVPVVHTDFTMGSGDSMQVCEELLKMADIPSPLNSNVPQEGLVFRMNGPGNRVSFKAISNGYLLKYGL